MAVLDVLQKLRPVGVLQCQILEEVVGVFPIVLVAEVIPLVPADHAAKVFLPAGVTGVLGVCVL